MNVYSPPGSITTDLVRYKTQIEAALVHADTSHSFDDIVRGVLTGALHFDPLTKRTCVIMEVQKYPRFSTYHVFLAAGSLDDLIRFQPSMMQNARKLGADRLTLTGRRGFARALKPHGWTERAVQLQIIAESEISGFAASACSSR